MQRYKISHITPGSYRQRQSLMQKAALWWDDNYEEIFKGFGTGIAIIVFLASLGVAYTALARSLGWK